jgi:hypothetical protein
LGGSAYVIGGFDAQGAPTDTVFVGTPDAATGKISTWTASELLKLPAPRADATAVISGDGLFLVGGRDAAGPVDSVWKAPLVSTTGKLAAWKPTGSLPAPRTDATAVLLGTRLYVYGGEDAAGPTTAVVIGEIGTEGESLGEVTGWWTPAADGAEEVNLPVAAKGAMGFVSNGTLYHVGGDGEGTIYWTTPDTDGKLTGWNTLTQSNLPADLRLQDAAPLVSGSHAFLFGGTAAGAPTQGITRASLAPPQPFFRLGLFYMVLPALGIQGEVGQQLSYLVAAGVATVNFVILLLIGYAYNHPEKTKLFFNRIRSRRRPAA